MLHIHGSGPYARCLPNLSRGSLRNNHINMGKLKFFQESCPISSFAFPGPLCSQLWPMEIDVDDKCSSNDEILDPRLQNRRNLKRHIATGICPPFLYGVWWLGRHGGNEESTLATGSALSDPVTFTPPSNDLGTTGDNLNTKNRRKVHDATCALNECCDHPPHVAHALFKKDIIMALDSLQMSTQYRSPRRHL